MSLKTRVSKANCFDKSFTFLYYQTNWPGNRIGIVTGLSYCKGHRGQETGLGLSLSYDVIKAHGGEMRVETKRR